MNIQPTQNNQHAGNLVVTGATKGIGRAIVELFAQQGFNIVFCARTETDVVDLQAYLTAQYRGEFFGHVVDMADKTAVKEFVRCIEQDISNVDVLVNNAGTFIPATLHDEDSEKAFDTMMALNINSAFYLTQGVLPSMLAQKSGHIFNICSIASFMPYGIYAISKHALLGYSKVLREETKAHNIKVTSVSPGATYTDSWAGTELPKERFIIPEDIAQSLWSIYQLSAHSVVEDFVIRPQLGDI